MTILLFGRIGGRKRKPKRNKHLNKYNLDDYDSLIEFTLGYLVKARKA